MTDVLTNVEPPPMKLGLRTILSSAVITGLFFCTVPMLETLRHLETQQETPRDFSPVPFNPPPLEQVVESQERVVEEPLVEPVRLEAPPPQIDVQAALETTDLSLTLALSDTWQKQPLSVSVRVPVAEGTGPVEQVMPEVFTLAQVDQTPIPTKRMRPIYPPRARMQRIEGWVEVEFIVNRDGRVEDLIVVGAHPDNTFVQSAERAIRRWAFKPGTYRGKAVPVRVRQKLSFDLK